MECEASCASCGRLVRRSDLQHAAERLVEDFARGAEFVRGDTAGSYLRHCQEYYHRLDSYLCHCHAYYLRLDSYFRHCQKCYYCTVKGLQYVAHSLLGIKNEFNTK